MSGQNCKKHYFELALLAHATRSASCLREAKQHHPYSHNLHVRQDWEVKQNLSVRGIQGGPAGLQLAAHDKRAGTSSTSPPNLPNCK
eukprot:3570757-Amphidinium_carterae.1